MLDYPLALSFKLLAFSPQIAVRDASGRIVLYVKQKALALREDVRVFADDSQRVEVYRIKADRVLDFSARYTITTPDGRTLGMVRREGARSLWSASYPIEDAAGQDVGRIHEESALVKVLDGLASMIPGVGLFSGLFLNPAYLVDLRGQTALYLKKERSVFESRFSLERRAELAPDDEALLLASLLMLTLLERDRG